MRDLEGEHFRPRPLRVQKLEGGASLVVQRSRKIPHAAEQLSPRATTTEAHAPRARAPQQEKPLQ